ncbi:MAG: histidine--tRNA ligase [Phycisphaerales bacterium]|nr:histidine--tRNA ligase [Phycisphaerales bacterium]
MAKVKPRVFRGLRDLLPEQMAARQWLIDTIRGVYERYGFVPLGTPAIEYLDVLSGSAGAEAQQSIFHVRNPEKRRDSDEEALGLRFDLTVPLARVISQYRDLPRPFRRYQVASVWRADKPDRGRFREFTQFDLDSVGVSSEVADVEIIAAMCDTLTALKVGSYRVRFSSRKILNLLLKYAEIPDQFEVSIQEEDGIGRPVTRTETRSSSDVFRVLDKLDKIGPDKVRLELTIGYTDKSGDRIPGLGLTNDQVDRIEKFLAIQGDGREDVLGQLREVFGPVPEAEEEIDVLAGMSRQLAKLGYEEDRAVIDLSIARGLAYYTGPVFEAILVDAPQFGSVFGGGRYDELVTRFIGERIPATGASIGVDRLLAALLELNRIPTRKSTAQVLVTALDSTMTDDYLELTFELRRAGISAELFLGKKGIGKQMKYADQQEIPLALMYGSDERDKGIVTLKNLMHGKTRSGEIEKREEWIRERPGQIEAPRGELVDAVRKMLSDVEQSHG